MRCHRDIPTSATGLSNFFRRRLLFGGVTTGCIALLCTALWIMNSRLQHGSFLSGYVLMGSLVFLMLLGMRKRLTFLPAIGSASFWAQMHIYVGISSAVVFLLHMQGRVPDGNLERFLAALYVIVAGSGFYGLYITRVLPQKLNAIQEEVIFERIPALRNELARRARKAVTETCEQSGVLGRFYLNRLIWFFERPRSLSYAIHPSGRRRRQLINEIEELDRFLSPEQRRVSRQLSIFVRKKDDLDFHWAMQGRLKLWLFLHIGVTYSLLIVAIIHGVMAHAFAGGL